jgi:hypothetical protein
MRENFTSGSVGRAPGNRCLYPEADRKKPQPLKSGFYYRGAKIMLLPPTYNMICNKLASDFYEYDYKPKERSRKHNGLMLEGAMVAGLPSSDEKIAPVEQIKRLKFGKVKLIGIIFSQPAHSLVATQILPNLEYYNIRSSNNIHIFFAGYGVDWPDGKYPDQKEVAIVKNNKWFFSSHAFNECLKDFEKRTIWHYSGETDIILTNMSLDPFEERPVLNLDSSISLNLASMINCKTISSVMELFENLFKHTAQQEGNNPTWGFSDKIGIDHIKDAIKRLVLSCLPKGIDSDLLKIEQYAVKDIRNKKPT